MKKIAIYSAHAFEKQCLTEANNNQYEFVNIPDPISAANTALAAGCIGVAVFTSDEVSEEVLILLKQGGIQFVVTRSTGIDHIDLAAAEKLGIKIANVPGYSPNAIAEHAIALMLALNRHLIASDKKVKKFNFNVDSFTGFNMQGKTVGIIGTGKIGAVVCKILHGFGCNIIAFDLQPEQELSNKYDVKYVPLENIFRESDIISLHVPLTVSTQYLINKESIAMMKKGVMLINVSRGKLVHTTDILAALNNGTVGFYGADVYENEKGIFFSDFSETGIKDELLGSLISNDRVMLTSHYAFLTNEALKNISDTTLENITAFANGKANVNECK